MENPKGFVGVIKNKRKWTHWDRDNMDNILQTTFSNVFSWMETWIFIDISLNKQ